MTTLGKILVFLVFVAALAMGGLMVYVAKATPPWKEAVQERDDKIAIYIGMREEEAKSRQKLIAENEKMKKLLDTTMIESKVMQEQYKIQAEDAKKQADEALAQQRKSDVAATQAQKEATRLQKEVLFQDTVVKEREKMILKLQEDIASARNAELSAKAEQELLKQRNLAMVEQLREANKTIQEMEKAKNSKPGSVASNGGTKDATYYNPPSFYVKGQIDQVDEKDKTLVKITIGSDAGIRKDQTLEVFRVNPKAEYLGRLVIVETDFRHAIGRLLRAPGAPAPALQVGDEVASKLRP
jgi:hypothetical protein